MASWVVFRSYFTPTQRADPVPRASPTYFYLVHPIRTPEEALARSEASLPAGTKVVTATARLLDMATVDAWRGGSSYGMAASAPVWLVGMRTTGLTMGHFLRPNLTPSPLHSPLYHAEVEGVFYVWDANSGFNVGEGTLGGEWGREYSDIVAFVSQRLVITTATAQYLPTPPFITPLAGDH
jgi:hypothetical protein